MVLNNSAVLANIPCMPDMTQSSVFLRKSAWVTTVELMELKFLKRNNKLELHHLLAPVSSCVLTPRLSECVAGLRLFPLNNLGNFQNTHLVPVSRGPDQAELQLVSAHIWSSRKTFLAEEFSRDFMSAESWLERRDLTGVFGILNEDSQREIS